MCETSNGPSPPSKPNARTVKISNIRRSLRQLPLLSKNQKLVENKLRQLNENQWESHAQNASTFEAEDKEVKPTFQHANIFAEKYEVLEKIGEGSNGIVHRCIKKQTGETYAVKSFMFDDEQLLELKNNFLMMKSIRHKNVVSYKALYIDMQKHSGELVMELCQGESLSRVSIDDEETLRKLMQELIEALHYLHERAIVHRDIKLENILYDPKDQGLKLIDFGICKKNRKRGVKTDMWTITGTLYYRAPEMLSGGGYNEKIDIWSTGIVLYKLVAGCTPFESEYHSQTILNILTAEVSFPAEFEKYSLGLKQLICRMLKKDPKERLKAIQCLRDSWFYPMTFPFPRHKGSYNQIEEHLKQWRKSPKKHHDFLEVRSYVKKINGDEFHCIDSDEEESKKHGKKTHKSFRSELHNFRL